MKKAAGFYGSLFNKRAEAIPLFRRRCPRFIGGWMAAAGKGICGGQRRMTTLVPTGVIS